MVTFTSKFSALVGFAFLACVAAAPLEAKSATAVTLPLIKHVYTSAQASSKRSSIADRRDNVPLTNLVAIYTVPVTIGSQTFNLFVDTASSVIWAGAGSTPYTGGPSSVDLGETFYAGYASGFAAGEEFIDTVTIGGFAVTNFPIGNATFVDLPDVQGNSVDGIIGLGTPYATIGIVTGPLSFGFDTFSTALADQKGIPNIYGLYLKPETGSDNDDVNGELTIGAIDSSKFTGEITYAPLSTVSRPPFNLLWSLDVSSVSIGSTVIQSASTGAIVDSGTTWLMLPYYVYSAFLTATGGSQGPESYSSWPSPPTETLTFNIAGSNITLTPAQYLITPEQLSNYNGPGFELDPTQTWSWIINGGPDDGFNFNYIFGQKFLESYYSIYDGENNRVGFAARV